VGATIWAATLTIRLVTAVTSQLALPPTGRTSHRLGKASLRIEFLLARTEHKLYPHSRQMMVLSAQLRAPAPLVRTTAVAAGVETTGEGKVVVGQV